MGSPIPETSFRYGVKIELPSMVYPVQQFAYYLERLLVKIRTFFDENPDCEF